MTTDLDLDHVAVVTRDLDRAERNYARLGFHLTVRSSHKGPVPPDDRIEPWGTGNHCAMFKRGYFELLGITHPDRFKAHIDRRLSRYEGLHLIAFGTADAERAVNEFRAKGARLSDPQIIGRDVPFGDGTRPGSFAIVNLDPEFYPEADFIVIEQQTREVLWQPDLMTHPNGAVSLESVTVCADDPSDLMRRLSAVLDAPAGAGFDLAYGRVNVISSVDLPRLFPECLPPREGACVVAASIGVEDLDKTAAVLTGNGVDFDQNRADSLRVGSAVGCGAIIDFVDAGAG